MAVKPKIASYGVSIGEYGGDNINDYTLSGYIDPRKLNKIELAEGLELNPFEQNIANQIYLRLGFGVVRVELNSAQIKLAIHEAITQINYWAPLWSRQFATFMATKGNNVYEIPSFILDNLTQVTYKKHLLTTNFPTESFESDIFMRYFSDQFTFSQYAIGEFYLLQQYMEMVRRALGNDGSWEVVGGKYLQLHPLPESDQPVIMEFRAMNHESIHSAYLSWIQRYATAVAKEILGQIRAKYNSIPSPGGGVTLNGSMLIEQGMSEKKDLIEELRFSIEEPPGFSVG